MQKVLAFIEAKSAVLVFAGIALGAGFVGYTWFQNQNGGEELLTVRADSFIQQVSVSGKVVAVDEVDLSFIQSGRVENVYVLVGDRSQQGRVLAELENNDVRALVLERRASLAAEEANLDSLLEGTREEEIAVVEADVASAEVTLSQAMQAMVEEIQDAFRAADDAVRVQVDQFISNPRTSPQLSFNTGNSSARTTTESRRFEMESILNTWETEVFSLTVDDDLETALVSAKTNLAKVSDLLVSAAAAINQGFPTGSVTSATIEGYATDVAAARSDISSAVTSLTSAETSKKSAAADLTSKQKSLALKKADATPSAVAAQRAKVDAARAQVLDAEAQLTKTFISAPFTGVVTKVEVEPGETVTAGELVISLISDDAFQIESFVPEINIALLSIDDTAEVTLDAYGENTVFMARIVQIDPAETLRDGVSTYRAVLEFTEDDDRVRAGMTANVIITTVEKENVIAVPQGIIEFRDGKRFVQVKTGEATVKREIEIGLASSSGSVEVVAGLSEGDIVVLSE